MKKVSKKFCHLGTSYNLCKVINNEKQEIMKKLSVIKFENLVVNAYNEKGIVVMSDTSFTKLKMRISKLIDKGVYCKENFEIVYNDYLKSINLR